MNPITLAFLLKSGQAPPPELIEQAKKLISMVVVPAPPPPPPVMKTNADGSSEPVAQPKQETAPPALKDVQLSLAPLGPDQPAVPPSPAQPGVGEDNPQWSALDRIRKRVIERE